MNNKAIFFLILLVCFITISCDKNDESINPIQSPIIQKSVGDTYQGGIVFYIDGNGGGLIAATSYQSRSEEHTSELQSQSTISYAVFCLKKKRIGKS